MYKVTKKKLKDVPVGHWVMLADKLIRRVSSNVYPFISGLCLSDSKDESSVFDFGPAEPNVFPGNYIETQDGSIWKIYIAGLGEQPEVGTEGLCYNTPLVFEKVSREPEKYKLPLVKISEFGDHYYFGPLGGECRFFAVCVYTSDPQETPEQKQLRRLKQRSAELNEQIQRLEANIL